MRFRIDTKELNGIITTVSKALSSHTTITILEGVYIEAIGKEVLFRCTDLSLQIETIVQADVEEDGGIVMPGRAFIEYVRRMPGETTLISTEGLRAFIESDRAKMQIQGSDISEFHTMPLVKNEVSVKIGMNVFKDMLKQCIFATAQDESKPILTGVLVEIHPDNINMVALDGYRLAMIKRSVTGGKEKNVVIPAKSLVEIGRILDDRDQIITVTFSRTHVFIDMDHTKITTRLLDGEFIKYKQILPKDHTLRVRAKRSELLEGIERAAIIAREEKSNLIRFKYEKDMVEISSNCEFGNSNEQIEVQCMGDPIEIAFNSRYLSEVLKVVDDEFVYLDMNNNISPCVVRPVEGEDYYYLVLPVRFFS